jgi:hypothetical protein
LNCHAVISNARHSNCCKMLIRYLGVLGCIALLAGCNTSSQEVAPVAGRITLNGKPLEFAMVTFHAEGKSIASSGTDKDGHYDLMYKRGVKGAPIGLNQVSILLDVEQAHRPQIPPQTDLKREVKPGPNVIDFDLKTESK